MTTLVDEFLRVFPSAKLFVDFEIYQDKNGVQEFQTWNEAVLGPQKTLEELVAMPDGQKPVKYSITPIETRKMLRGANLLSTFEAFIAESDEREDFWYEMEITRDNAVLCTFLAAQGLSPDQIDNLFRL